MDDDAAIAAEIITEFLVESHEDLDRLDRDLVELEQRPGSPELLASVFRAIHTIKGTSGFLALGRLEALTHAGETLLAQLRDGERTMTPGVAEVLLEMVDTVRALLAVVERTGADAEPAVDVEGVVARLERLLAEGDEAPGTPDPTPMVPPVVPPVVPSAPRPEAAVQPEAAPESAPETAPETAPESAPETGAETGAGADPDRRTVADASVRVDVELLDSLVDLVGELVLTRNQLLQRTGLAQDVELVRAGQRLDLVASELQESVMRTRMQPIGQVWARMPRMVRDLGHQLGREVDLAMEGHDTELDRSLLEALSGPLTHLVRNALDHGIEPPAEREARGKARAGRLHLRAFHESGQVVVEISDDGRGIDADKVAAAAVARGLVSRDQVARMEPRALVELIFRPGFSTAGEVTNVSGRGVGMDVVRTNIERIGGSVDLHSTVGCGTTVRVRIPLTLAIIPALVVEEAGERYAIAQANLLELVRVPADDPAMERLGGAAVLRLRGRLLPLVSLAETLGLPPPPPEEASTVVVVQADEIRFGLRVSEVHDTQEIVVKPIGRQLKGLEMYAGATIMGDGRVALILDVAGLARAEGIVASGAVAEPERATAQDATALLVLEVAEGRRAALPLAAVARLEEFALDRVERSGGVEVVQYRDGILPLVRLAPAIGLPDPVRERDTVSVVVHEREDGAVGIVIDRVLDVVETAVAATAVGRRPGVSGSAVVQGRVTDLVDLPAVVGRIA